MNDQEFLALVADARDWIADAFTGVDAEKLSASEVRRGVQRHYEGGWSAFVADNGVHVYVGAGR